MGTNTIKIISTGLFSRQTSLTTLFLSNNAITSVQAGAFTSQSQLQIL